MNLELSQICANNVELRIDIKRMLDKRREMIEEYNRLSMVRQNATDQSRQLTSECSESFANRYEKLCEIAILIILRLTKKGYKILVGYHK